MLGALSADPDILVCRLVAHKITLVHRRLWPALAAAAPALDAALPAHVVEAASRLGPEAALAALGPALVTKPGQRNPREKC